MPLIIAGCVKEVLNLPTKHTIIQGTCEDMNEIRDDSISLIVTSPPYFNAIYYGDTGNSNIGNSQELSAYKQYLSMMKKVYTNCYNKLKSSGHLIVNVSDVILNKKKYPVQLDTGRLLLEIFNWNGYLDIIYWKKPDGMTSSQRFGVFIQNPYPMYYRPDSMTEQCIVFIKGNKNYNFDKEKNKLRYEDFRKYQNDVWQIQPETYVVQSGLHPAPFPLELPSTFIKLFSLKGDTILDPFLGSGTTMVAARNLERNSYGYELNPEYVENAIKERLGIKQGFKCEEGIKDMADNLYIILKQNRETNETSSNHPSGVSALSISPVDNENKERNQDWKSLSTNNEPEEIIEVNKYTCRSCFSKFFVIEKKCYKEKKIENAISDFTNNCPYCNGTITAINSWTEPKWKLKKEKEVEIV